MAHLIDWPQFIKFIVAILTISNPFGGVAIFISLMADKSVHEHKKTAVTTAFAVFIVMMLFLWFGEYILKFFSISIGSFETAGGLVILLLGLSMLRSERSKITQTSAEQSDAKHKESIAIVPMAIPLITGPGVITTLIVASHRFTDFIDKIYLSAGCLAITLFIGSLLYYSNFVNKLLGVSGLKIIIRIMGLILMAIAAEIMASGIKQLFG